MVSYRPFLNGDVPAVVDIWRNHGPDPALAANISIDLFDKLVLSKPYFDREGLIMALKGQEVIGFVHAGFGPDPDELRIDVCRGVVSLLLLHADCEDLQVADGLLKQAEQYLKERGAEEIFGIGFGNLCPFYLGLYGGCDLPGVLESDTVRQELFARNGYLNAGRILRYGRELEGYRPVMDRNTLLLRRNTRIEFVTDPPSRSWWDACTQGCLPQLEAVVRPVSGGPGIASVIFWDMQTLTGHSENRIMGLSSIRISDPERTASAAKYLLAESFRYLQQQGIGQVQGQCREDDSVLRPLLEATGFEQRDAGIILKKRVL